MKSKTMLSSVLALVVVLSISMLALVGCTDGAPEDTPEDAQAVTSEVAENTQTTDEQTEAIEAIPEATAEENVTNVAAIPNGDNNTAYTPSQGSSGSNSGASAQGTPKAQSAPVEPAHEHNWIDITETRTVTDKAAWNEPIEGIICSCGQVFTDKGSARSHIGATGHASGGGIVDYKYHPAQTHTETVVVGQKCSSCGATK